MTQNRYRKALPIDEQQAAREAHFGARVIVNSDKHCFVEWVDEELRALHDDAIGAHPCQRVVEREHIPPRPAARPPPGIAFVRDNDDRSALHQITHMAFGNCFNIKSAYGSSALHRQ